MSPSQQYPALAVFLCFLKSSRCMPFQFYVASAFVIVFLIYYGSASLSSHTNLPPCSFPVVSQRNAVVPILRDHYLSFKFLNIYFKNCTKLRVPVLHECQRKCAELFSRYGNSAYHIFQKDNIQPFFQLWYN